MYNHNPEEVPLKHQLLLEEYLVNGFNGTRAYMKIYDDCTFATAKSAACRIIKLPYMQAEIEKYKQENKIQNGIDISYIVSNLIELIEGSKEDEKIDRISILKALDQLSKISGIYTTNIKTEVINPLESITINIKRADDN